MSQYLRRAFTSFSLPAWAPFAALVLGLLLAWPNFLLAGRWADIEGSLRGGKAPWYAAVLIVTTALAILHRRRVGQPLSLGLMPAVLTAIGVVVLVTGFLFRLPPATWSQMPFWDDWTPLFQAAITGVQLLERGTVHGWNWWFLGGYPTSNDIAQNFAVITILPMKVFGDLVGLHLVQAVWFLSVPVFVWWDIRQEDRQTGLLAAGLACFFAVGFFGNLGRSGDVNSMCGVFAAGLAMMGSRAARLDRRWGGPVLMLGLTFALYSHVAFFVYAVIFLALEALYFKDRSAALRLVVATTISLVASLPMHWESLRYSQYVSFNNVAFTPGAPKHLAPFLRSLYYNVEILVLPGRWFNDYRSLANVWLPVLALVALLPGRTRVGFYAWATLVTQGLLRLNSVEFGAGFDRIMHMLPLLTAPALAGFIVRCAGTRALATALAALLALYVQISLFTVPHVNSVRDFNPTLIDRMATLDGNMVLVEINPHRDMDSDPVRHSVRSPFGVHYEALLPTVAGQRFYAQMWDGWVWNGLRGQVVAGGTFNGAAISKTAPDAFEAEMRRWGVKHLLVWSDETRSYLAANPHFVNGWREGTWSHFELANADDRSIVVSAGTGRLTDLDLLGANVELRNVVAGEPVVIRTNYYPAWEASADGRVVPLFNENRQLAFNAPASGSYVVSLKYPRRPWLPLVGGFAFIAGIVVLRRWPRQDVA